MVKKAVAIGLSAVMLFSMGSAALAGEAAETSEDTSLVVEVDGGSIQGGVDENGVRYYKGIPFAADAGGENRFRDPQPVESWEGILDCTEYGPIAIQDVNTSAYGKWTAEYMDVNKTEENGLMSENCLNLNVWTMAEEGAKLPVIVYIHGGGNTSGSGACEIYTGEKLAQKNVVYVSINYRLGAFAGLVYTDENGEQSTGNFGIKDQIAALKWVQNNIEKFGGDPENVTIAGQSAGSADCQALLISPAAEGLFDHVVCMSALSYPGRVVTQEEAQANVEEALAGVTLEELRSMPAQEIQSMGLQTSFHTMDGEYVTQTEEEAFASGDYNTSDIMWGCVSGDSALFGGGFMAYMDPTVVADTYEEGIALTWGDALESFRNLYPVVDGNYEEIIAQARAVIGAKSYYQAAQAKQAGDAEHNNYVYYFDHVIPDTQERMDAYGAFHTSDVSYWTNYYSGSYPRDWQEYDYELGDLMSDYLVNFAATGDPNGEGLPEWKAVARTQGISYMHLGDTVEFVELDSEKNDFWNTASYESVNLDELSGKEFVVPDEYTKIQTFEVKTGKFPGTPMTVYSNEEGNKLYFVFDLYEPQRISCTLENGEIVSIFDPLGFFGADVLDFIQDVDPEAWTERTE